MKRLIFLLSIFTLLTASVFAQVPDPYDSYEKRQKERLALQDQFDIVIDDPQIGAPMAYSDISNTGSVAYEYHNIDDFVKLLAPKLKGKVITFRVDTNCETVHESIQSKAMLNSLGKNFTNEEGCEDKHGHGTMVDGTMIAYNTNFDIGVGAYLANEGYLAIVPIKGLTSQGAGMMEWISNAIYYIIGLADDIKDAEGEVNFTINLSLGSSAQSEVLAKAVLAAREANILVFAASGNNGQNDISSPADAKGACAIGALSYDYEDAELSWFSNYGKEQFITAIGSNVLTTNLDNSYSNVDGTSFSSPIASTIASWLWSMYPTATANQIERALTFVTEDLGDQSWDQKYGYGTIRDADKLAKINPTTLEDRPIYEDEDVTEPEIPTREKREMTLIINDIPCYWARMGESWNVSHTDLTFKIKSEYEDEYISEVLNELIFDYFSRSGVVLYDYMGYVDANRWIPHFLNNYIKSYFDYDIQVVSSVGEYNGNICYTDEFGWAKGLGSVFSSMFKKKPFLQEEISQEIEAITYPFDVTIEVDKGKHLIGYPYTTIRRNYKINISPAEFYSKGSNLVVKEKLGDVKYWGTYRQRLYSNQKIH